VTYSGDGTRVVVASGVWNLNEVQSERFVCNDLAPATRGTFRGAGDLLLLCGAKNGSAAILTSWDIEKNEKRPVVTVGEGNSVPHAFSPDGTRIVFGCEDGFLRVRDTEKGKELIAIPWKAARPLAAGIRLQSVAISPDNTWIASSDGKQITIFHATTGGPKRTFAQPPDGVGHLAISPDGARIASSDKSSRSGEPMPAREAQVLIWDVETGRPLRSCFVPSNESERESITCLTFSPDGRSLVAGHGTGVGTSSTGAGTLTMWDAQTGVILRNLKGHMNAVWSATFSPDGQRLATGSQDEAVRLWDLETGQEVLTLRFPNPVSVVAFHSTIAFSPDGKRLVAGVGHNTVTVWEAP
jgi:WD40 repeat protein